jgi:NAD(P)-dependent dehydrogenase (short-subunit alcohol dehydrogenase family)
MGAACAATLARESAKVVVTDLDDAGGQSVVDEIGSAGGSAVFLHQDVSLEEARPGVIEATERQFGRLDVMVANAGIGITCRAVEMTLAARSRQHQGQYPASRCHRHADLDEVPGVCGAQHADRSI